MKHICEYGCGQEAKHYFSYVKKWCCSKYASQCPVLRKNHSDFMKGNKYTLNYNPTKETRKLMSEAKIGKPGWNKGLTKETDKRVMKISRSKEGYKQTAEHIRKNRESHIGLNMGDDNPMRKPENALKITGEKNGNWIKDRSKMLYCDIWLDQEYKQSLKDRDGNKCLNPECNRNSKRICVHHINYNKKDCKPTNLITVCIGCNTKANTNRDWHKSWYRAIMYRRYGYEY